MFFFVVVLSLLGTAVYAQDVHLALGQNATTADPHQYPWLLNLVLVNNSQDIHLCGASLLRIKDGLEQSDMVLTAAHCIVELECLRHLDPECEKPQASTEYMDKKSLTIIAGDHKLDHVDDGEKRFRIDKMLFYGNNAPRIDDLAVIKLSSPVSFNEKMKPIELAKKGEVKKPGEQCTVAGWGDIYGKTSPDALQHANVTIRSCKKDYSNMFFDADDYYLCASTSAGLTAVCHGDSGSPLICKSDNKWKVYGVVKGGKESGCANGKTPPLYMKISKYADWIEKQIRTMSSLWPKNAKTRHSL